MAQKIIQTTVESIILSDILGVTINRNSDNSLSIFVRYALRTDTGIIYEEKEVPVTVSVSERQQLKTFVENVIIPKLNSDLGF